MVSDPTFTEGQDTVNDLNESGMMKSLVHDLTRYSLAVFNNQTNTSLLKQDSMINQYTIDNSRQQGKDRKSSVTEAQIPKVEEYEGIKV